MNQQQKRRLRILSRSHWRLKLILLPIIFKLDSVVVKREKNVKLAWRLLYLSYVLHRTNNQIYKHTIRTKRKWLSTH